MKSKLFVLVLFMLVVTGQAFSQSFRVIVNSGNPLSSLSKKEASDYFLKKKVKWSDGSSVMPVDQSSGSKVREDFSQAIHGKATFAIRSYWQQAVFSGTSTIPPEKPTDAEVIDYVRRFPGAIGYVSASAGTDGVKAITIH